MAKTSKRFVTIAEYQRISGLSYQTIKNALESGQLRGITTEAGFWKIDLESENTNLSAVIKRLDTIEDVLKGLALHLGASGV